MITKYISMKTLILTTILSITALSAFSQGNGNGGGNNPGFISVNDTRGQWTDDNTWVGGTAPGTSISGQDDVTIDGDVQLIGDLSVSSTLTINVEDTLHVVGNLDVTGSGEIFVNGVLIVSGDYSGNGNSEISNTGVVLIDGNFSSGNNTTISNDSDSFYVTGNSDFNDSKDGSDLSTEQPELFNEFITAQPVELLTFEGYAQGSSVQLMWVTAMEENFDFFTVERAGNDMKFEAIGTLGGQGNSSVEVTYEFADHSPLQGQALYRLKATDLDGTIEYHRIIAVHFEGTTNYTFNVYPNPVSNHRFTVSNDNGNTESLQLVDMSGTVVLSQNVTAPSGQVEIPQSVKPGAYVLIVTTLSGNKSQQRIMVM